MTLIQKIQSEGKNMPCPICFFREPHQQRLKRETFGTDRFEKKLAAYQRQFLAGIQNMTSLSGCACLGDYSHPLMIAWTDAFLSDLQKSTIEINAAFDDIISIYEDFISKHQNVAINNLWKYLNDKNMLSTSEDFLSYFKLFFRGRLHKGFDCSDIEELFHIPFTKRNLIGNQRFSISGQPMLYFSSSIFAVTKELEIPVNKLATAAFLPLEAALSSSKIFSLKNYFNNYIENTLPAIFDAESQLSYSDCFNKKKLESAIHRTIFSHICTFPREARGSFSPEYVIPQILTTALLEHGYDGLLFPSTKDYSELSGQHRFSSHHINIAMFVPYDPVNDLNVRLLNKFKYFTLAKSSKAKEIIKLVLSKLSLAKYDAVNIEAISTKIEGIVEKNKASTVNNNAHIIPIVDLKLHLEYMQTSTVNGKPYFKTSSGKKELKLYMKMLKHLDAQIR